MPKIDIHIHIGRELFNENKAEVAPVQQTHPPQQVTSELYRIKEATISKEHKKDYLTS